MLTGGVQQNVLSGGVSDTGKKAGSPLKGCVSCQAPKKPKLKAMTPKLDTSILPKATKKFALRARKHGRHAHPRPKFRAMKPRLAPVTHPGKPAPKPVVLTGGLERAEFRYSVAGGAGDGTSGPGGGVFNIEFGGFVENKYNPDGPVQFVTDTFEFSLFKFGSTPPGDQTGQPGPVAVDFDGKLGYLYMSRDPNWGFGPHGGQGGGSFGLGVFSGNTTVTVPNANDPLNPYNRTTVGVQAGNFDSNFNLRYGDGRDGTINGVDVAGGAGVNLYGFSGSQQNTIPTPGGTHSFQGAGSLGVGPGYGGSFTNFTDPAGGHTWGGGIQTPAGSLGGNYGFSPPGN
jgi:hypothetical protein